MDESGPMTASFIKLAKTNSHQGSAVASTLSGDNQKVSIHSKVGLLLTSASGKVKT